MIIIIIRIYIINHYQIEDYETMAKKKGLIWTV